MLDFPSGREPQRLVACLDLPPLADHEFELLVRRGVQALTLAGGVAVGGIDYGTRTFRVGGLVPRIRLDLHRGGRLVRTSVLPGLDDGGITSVASSLASDQVLLSIDIPDSRQLGDGSGALMMRACDSSLDGRAQLLVAIVVAVVSDHLDAVADVLDRHLRVVAAELPIWGGYVALGELFEWTQHELDTDLEWLEAKDANQFVRGANWITWLGQHVVARLGGEAAVREHAPVFAADKVDAPTLSMCLKATARVSAFSAESEAALSSYLRSVLRPPDEQYSDASVEGGDEGEAETLVRLFGYDPREPGPSSRADSSGHKTYLRGDLTGGRDPIFLVLDVRGPIGSELVSRVQAQVARWTSIAMGPDDHISDVDGPLHFDSPGGSTRLVWTIDAALASDATLEAALGTLEDLRGLGIQRIEITERRPVELGDG